MRTLRDLQAEHDSDDDEDHGQEYYAGGEKSYVRRVRSSRPPADALRPTPCAQPPHPTPCSPTPRPTPADPPLARPPPPHPLTRPLTPHPAHSFRDGSGVAIQSGPGAGRRARPEAVEGILNSAREYATRSCASVARRSNALTHCGIARVQDGAPRERAGPAAGQPSTPCQAGRLHRPRSVRAHPSIREWRLRIHVCPPLPPSPLSFLFRQPPRPDTERARDRAAERWSRRRCGLTRRRPRARCTGTDAAVPALPPTPLTLPTHT